VAQRLVSGIAIEQESGPGRAIARVPTSIAAFVGRTLKGPVNRPREIHSFQEFTQIFGGLWQPAPLPYAVEQFFENGGRKAIIVRVANSGRPPTLTLPAGSGSLALAGLAPGSREYLRASVDYDGIGDLERDRFNLVVQRVRAPGSEYVEDQEIFRRLSVTEESSRFVADVLPESRLVRLVGPVPPERPDVTPSLTGSAAIGYVASRTDGDDGGPLSDYDIIGSAVEGTGIFALRAMPNFGLLCIPPLARDQDVGASTLLVAGRFCREHHAMLVVDPPASWTSADLALAGMRDWPYRSDSALMYFPRVLAFDRLRGRYETFGSCGAAAGMIARADDAWPVWAAAEAEEAVLRPGLKPACLLSESDRVRLAAVGINTLSATRQTTRSDVAPRTLAAGSQGNSDWKYLSARRLALFLTASIERGTRWMLLERNRPDTWRQARAQVESFLEGLNGEGAFAGHDPHESYFVICDHRLNSPQSIAAGRVSLLFGFAATRPGEFHTFLVTHQPGASRVRQVTVNRLTTSARNVEVEIETAVLRGLVALA
jgi:phage tail sheath protein FI